MQGTNVELDAPDDPGPCKQVLFACSTDGMWQMEMWLYDRWIKMGLPLGEGANNSANLYGIQL